MSITFAGVPLLLPDPEGRLERFLDSYQCLDAWRVFAPQSTWQTAERGHARSGFTAAVNLAAPNWPFVPKPRLNTLYWPTGAARWARGLFLATGNQVQRILTEIAPSSGGATLGDSYGDLVLRDDQSGTEVVAVGMHLLQPRPISTSSRPIISPSNPGEESLWLLPIVDDRYFWQWIDLGAIDPGDALDETSTWSDLWTLIQTALGTTITRAAVPADYFQPDPREFTREHQNIAMLMDAAAASNGQRVIRLLDGTVKCIDGLGAETALAVNLSGSQPTGGAYQTAAGNDFSTISPWSITPEKVKVVFPRYDFGRPSCDGEVYAKEVTASSMDQSTYRSNLVKTFFCTAFADKNGGSGSPINDLDLTTLAEKIARDYYLWLVKQFDYTFAGLKKWDSTGLEDFVEYCFGAHERGQYHAYTRAYSFPPNFGVEDLANQFELPVYDEWLTVKLEGTLSAGGSVTCGIWEHDGMDWQDTGHDVTAYDDTTSMTGESGDWAYLHWHCQSKRWQIAQKEC